MNLYSEPYVFAFLTGDSQTVALRDHLPTPRAFADYSPNLTDCLSMGICVYIYIYNIHNAYRFLLIPLLVLNPLDLLLLFSCLHGWNILLRNLQLTGLSKVNMQQNNFPLNKTYFEIASKDMVYTLVKLSQSKNCQNKDGYAFLNSSWNKNSILFPNFRL